MLTDAEEESSYWIQIICLIEYYYRIELRDYFIRMFFSPAFWGLILAYLTITPRARMSSELIAHEAEGRMGYWLRGHEGERNNCFSKIQLVGQKYRE